MARRLDLHAWDGLPNTAEQGKGWALVQGDCIEALEALPPHSVDVVFADPPVHALERRHDLPERAAHEREQGRSGTPLAASSRTTRSRRAGSRRCRRVLKPSGTIWVSGTQHVIFSIGFAMQEIGYHLLNTITWYKPNAVAEPRLPLLHPLDRDPALGEPAEDAPARAIASTTRR